MYNTQCRVLSVGCLVADIAAIAALAAIAAIATIASEPVTGIGEGFVAIQEQREMRTLDLTRSLIPAN